MSLQLWKTRPKIYNRPSFSSNDETIKRTLDRYSQVGDKRLIDCISPNEESSAKKRQVSVEPENEEQEHDNEERDNQEQVSDEQVSDCESGGWNDEELVAIVNQAKQSFSAVDEHDLLLKIDKRTKNMEERMSSWMIAIIGEYNEVMALTANQEKVQANNQAMKEQCQWTMTKKQGDPMLRSQFYLSY